jgi:hypothetical protein
MTGSRKPELSQKQYADGIKHLLKAAPYLDVFYYFGVEPGLLLKEASRPAQKGKDGCHTYNEYKLYIDHQVSSKPEWVKGLMAKLSDPADRISSFDEFLSYSDFIRQLPKAQLSFQHISELLQRFTVYCAEELSKKSIDIHTMRVYGIFALVVPFMRFSRSSTRTAALAITEQFEGIIDEVQKAVLQDSHGMHLRIEFKNMLVFSYMLVCHAITIGLSATVLSYHLYLFRAISVADWTGLPARLRLQYTILCLHLMLCFYAFDAPFESKFGIGAKTLTDLRMLLESATTDSDREHMSVHQCVFRWFLDKLDADMEWGGRVSTSRQTLPLLTAGEQDLIVELTRRFSHYRYPITTSHIAEFVGQFGTTQRIKAVLRMLSSVRLYPLWEISEAIERLLAAELDQFGGIVIAPLGDLTGSTSILAYMAAHSRLKNIVFAENVEKALEMTSRGGRVYFIDDCVISATQSLSIIGDLTGMRKLKQHHTRYCQPLSEFYKTEFMNRKVIFVYCIATDFALERLRANLPGAGLESPQYEVKFAINEPLSQKAFGSLSRVPWVSPKERDDLKQYCAEVGYDLLAGRAMQKNWTSERQKESALGYSDFQRLIVFPYSVPKSSITLLWANGNEERSWFPLFPVLE